MLTKMQQAFVSNEVSQGKTESDVLNALRGYLFADAIHCLNDDWSTGSTFDDSGVSLPMLYITFAEAAAAHADSVADFLETHDEPEDEYEGQVVAVRWADGDVLEIYLLDEHGIPTDDLLGKVTANRAMGF